MKEILNASNARVLRELSRTLDSYLDGLPDDMPHKGFLKRMSAAIETKAAQLSFEASALETEVKMLREQNHMLVDEFNRRALHKFATQ